ncbi:hypothetical protein [Leclercia adecarboxylata]|uniref:hypothetical protein n=1 Tax=Leclercia adecarboxylata TaxID=83655 RepID=UPI0021B2D21E|nr:hypothetical protein [Leclercia adecarboxylata]
MKSSIINGSEVSRLSVAIHAAKKEAALQKEEEKNKGLEQLADQFALEKQPFIDALAIAGKSPEQQRKCLWTT